jgi:hypothetical protein
VSFGFPHVVYRRSPRCGRDVTVREAANPSGKAGSRGDAGLTELPEPAIGEIVAGTVGRPAWRIHLSVGTHWDLVPLNFAATVAQVADQFLAGIQLGTSRLAAVEVADEADA